MQTHEQVGQWVWDLKSNAELGQESMGNLLYASPLRFIASLIKGLCANIHSLKPHWLRPDFLLGVAFGMVCNGVFLQEIRAEVLNF